MRSGGIISLTLKSLPTSGNAIPLAQLTWRRPAQVPTRVTPGGRQLPRRKDAYGSSLTQRSRSAASRGSLYFAWGCFRDFFVQALPCTAEGTNRSSSNTSSSSGSSAAGAPAASGTTTGSSTNGTTTGSTAGSTTTGPAIGPTYTQSPSGNTLGPNASPSGSTLTPTGPGSGMGR